METISNGLDLRPCYDLPLTALDDDLTSRGIVYAAIKPGSKVLDVGCDTGRFGAVLQANKGCLVDGIEPHPPAAEIARTRLREVFPQSILDRTSFAGLGGYDAVLFLDVLEHLINPWEALRGAFSVLVPGGSILVVVPNVAHIAIVRRLLRGQFDYAEHGAMDRTHVRWFTRKSLRGAFEEAAFTNVTLWAVPQIPHVPSRSLRRWLTKLFPNQLAGAIVAQAIRPVAGVLPDGPAPG